jgi:cell division protein FtsI (penicillin-binding protein 3)
MKAEQHTAARIWLAYLAMVLFAVGIAVKLFTIQLIEGEQWAQRARQVAMDMRPVQPDRGHIVAEDGRMLATSVPEYELRMDTRADGLTEDLFATRVDSLARGLSALFGDRSAAAYSADLRAARARSDRYHLIKRKVDHVQMQAVGQLPLFRLGKYKGGLVQVRSTARMHPFGRLAERTVGKLLKDGSGNGLEAGFDTWLRGRTGQRLERRLSGNVWMPVEDGEGVEPEAGATVHSTIDINLQDVADEALETQLRKHGAHHGCVVIMEVSTGYIRAISNLTRVHDSTYVEDLNYAVGQSTEPGSTFKLAALMVGLEDGLLQPEQLVDTKDGTHRFHDRVMRDSHEGGYGKITLRRAFELSSNTGISIALDQAYAKDPQRFVDGLRDLGLGEPLGLAIPGEGLPILRGPTQSGWSGTSLPWMSIGYAVTMTPLQTLALYNAVANNGRLLQPQFVDRISHNGRTTKEFGPQVLRPRICSDRTLTTVRGMLEGVVDSGTATNLRNAHFRIAGKTGTALIAKGKSGYKGDGISYQASFVGYFPAAAPRYSCIVVVSSPSKFVYYGNVVAGPIFREIADKVHANRLELQDGAPQLARGEKRSTPTSLSGHGTDLRTAFDELGIAYTSDSKGEWVSTQAGDSAVHLRARTVPEEGTQAVPNVLGMGLRDALYLLENRGLRVSVRGSGMVRRQSLAPGTHCGKGCTIHIELV